VLINHESLQAYELGTNHLDPKNRQRAPSNLSDAALGKEKLPKEREMIHDQGRLASFESERRYWHHEWSLTA
jgi:hypothetical protein